MRASGSWDVAGPMCEEGVSCGMASDGEGDSGGGNIRSGGAGLGLGSPLPMGHATGIWNGMGDGKQDGIGTGI